jgi:hypothetical protein
MPTQLIRPFWYFEDNQILSKWSQLHLPCTYGNKKGFRKISETLSVIGGAYRNRTDDLFNAIEARYQLR